MNNGSPAAYVLPHSRLRVRSAWIQPGLGLLLAQCSPTTDSLGTNATAALPDAAIPDTDTSDEDVSVEEDSSSPPPSGGAGPSSGGAGASSGGAGGAGPTPPEPPGSVFAEVLGVTQEDVEDRIDTAFTQLFHGDPDEEAIYYESGDDEAYIQNVLEGLIKTDGMGYGLLIAVELGKKEEFDRLWAYTENNLQYASGVREGYLYWTDSEGVEMPDPNGMSYAATALLFARARWGDPAYQDDAEVLLHAMLHREDDNGGEVVEDVHNIFDADTGLVVQSPMGISATHVHPGFVMPGFYVVWADRGPAEDRERWEEITDAARDFLPEAVDEDTGLPPDLTNLDGSAVTDRFGTEAVRVGLNLAVDYTWHAADPWQVEQADRWLGFFADEGLDEYVGAYTIDGEPRATTRSGALIAINGALAAVATLPEREDFVQAVWDLPVPTGDQRYYEGVMYLMSLLLLGGKLSVI